MFSLLQPSDEAAVGPNHQLKANWWMETWFVLGVTAVGTPGGDRAMPRGRRDTAKEGTLLAAVQVGSFVSYSNNS